ncbi:MAG: hypothetical protein QG597_3808, partial [Actinomycetota bacterium]|nr:hypothetical protein [Actinomycetota bacterium]
KALALAEGMVDPGDISTHTTHPIHANDPTQ